MTTLDFYSRVPGLMDRRGAGGVVVRLENGEVLVALMKEVEVGDAHYVLPKGGLEPGEDVYAAARREIHEEAGLDAVDHLLDLGELGRVSFNRKYWQVSYYGLYYARQRDSRIVDTHNHYGFGWFPIDGLPPLFWNDERALIENNRDRIVTAAHAHAGQRA